MKTRLFFAAILIVLSLVGYKTYKETQVIKSIDSYESCVAASGSVIQESYPATCITRLGARFTQIIVEPALTTYTNGTMKISFEYPSTLIVSGNNESLGVSLGSPETGGLGFEVSMTKNVSVKKLFNEDQKKFEGYLQDGDTLPTLKTTTINSYQAKEVVFKNAVYGVDVDQYILSEVPML